MLKIGIVGGTGYTGVELLRLLAQHPGAEVEVITSRGESGNPVWQLFPSLRDHYDIAFSEPDVKALSRCDIVFFATPHGVAQDMMPELIAAGARVIDLSADFRIKDVRLWEQWYGQAHKCPELVDSAVYGLPEINRKDIKDAQLVACAGCYPTSVQLGFLPLLENNLIEPSSLIASCASGVSGAGRQAKMPMILAEAGESFKAYSVSGHRHLPELEQGLRAMSSGRKADLSLTFVPHLLPITRGIHSTLYAKVTGDASQLQALYESRFENERFVDVMPAGVYPETKSVRASNTCRIAVEVPQDRDTVVVMSVIDNLTKGAAGQAVQVMNIMSGLDETSGLLSLAVVP